MGYYVTGNEYVSLPTIREEDAALEGISFLHMGAKGMLELRGSDTEPLLRPVVSVDGEELPIEDLKWERLHYWIPKFICQLSNR